MGGETKVNLQYLYVGFMLLLGMIALYGLVPWKSLRVFLCEHDFHYNQHRHGFYCRKCGRKL